MISRIFTIIIATGIMVFSQGATAEIARVSSNPNLQKIANKVLLSVEIDAPIEEVWLRVATNFDHGHRFNVDSDQSYFLEGTTAAIGARRRVIDRKGKFIDTEIFRMNSTEKFISWEIYATNVAPMKFAYSTYELRKISDTKTELKQSIGFKMDSLLLDSLARLQFPNLFKTELAAIKHLIEQGEEITPSNKRKIRSRYFAGIKVRKSF